MASPQHRTPCWSVSYSLVSCHSVLRKPLSSLVLSHLVCSWRQQSLQRKCLLLPPLCRTAWWLLACELSSSSATKRAGQIFAAMNDVTLRERPQKLRVDCEKSKVQFDNKELSALHLPQPAFDDAGEGPSQEAARSRRCCKQPHWRHTPLQRGKPRRPTDD